MKNRKALGKKIHGLLNLTLSRKLTEVEYTSLVLLIADVFDLSGPKQVKQQAIQEIEEKIKALKVQKPTSEREKGVYEIKTAWLTEMKEVLLTPCVTLCKDCLGSTWSCLKHMPTGTPTN